MAAVLGAEIDVELLAQVVRLPEDDVAQVLDEGVAAGLLVESGPRGRAGTPFPHTVVRDALRSRTWAACTCRRCTCGPPRR